MHMHLKRRVAKLESSAAAHRARLEPELSPEDRAIMQRIVERTYADPVRYAKRIALFERAKATIAHAECGEAHAGG